MNYLRLFLIKAFLVLGVVYASAQNENGYTGTHKIVLPDIPGYLTLKCDFHIHTVFSDGSVWPSARVDEAVRGGLDAIAITDHIEYQPHKGDVNTDHNQSYKVAAKYAEGKEILVIQGTEITRDLPPGHCNAIFVKDANKIDVPNPMDAFKEAAAQNAFIFWDHPSWPRQRPNGVAEMTDMHKELIKKGYLNGIEIGNGGMYSDEALEFASKYHLTVMCNTDIHGLGEWEWSEAKHRPVTLVFAKERTEESIKEALIAGRTAAYQGNYLIGNEDLLASVFKASLKVEATYAKGVTVATVKITNNSDMTYYCENKSKYTFNNSPYFFVIPAQGSKVLQVKTSEVKDSFELKFLVHNLVEEPGEGTEVNITVPVLK